VLSDRPHDELDAPTRVAGPAAQDVGIDSLSVAAGPGLPARVLIAVTVDRPRRRRRSGGHAPDRQGDVGDLDLESRGWRDGAQGRLDPPRPGHVDRSDARGVDDYAERSAPSPSFRRESARIAVIGPAEPLHRRGARGAPRPRGRRYRPGSERPSTPILAIYDRACAAGAARRCRRSTSRPRPAGPRAQRIEAPMCSAGRSTIPSSTACRSARSRSSRRPCSSTPPAGRCSRAPRRARSSCRTIGRRARRVRLRSAALRLAAHRRVSRDALPALVWARSRRWCGGGSRLETSAIELAKDVPRIVERLDVPDTFAARAQHAASGRRVPTDRIRPARDSSRSDPILWSTDPRSRAKTRPAAGGAAPRPPRPIFARCSPSSCSPPSSSSHRSEPRCRSSSSARSSSGSCCCFRCWPCGCPSPLAASASATSSRCSDGVVVCASSSSEWRSPSHSRRARSLGGGRRRSIVESSRTNGGRPSRRGRAR
jgi:hypothetical protein